MSFIPLVCPPASGGAGGPDIEQTILCDIGPDGEVLGTALAVYEYDTSGNPVGPPTFVDPATGLEYVPQGILQPCPGEVGCLAPVQFCFTSTSTGPVDHPGRQYDITLPINPGFAVQSLQVDAVNHAANIVWDVSDPDGEGFRQELTTFMEGRLPAPAVVTITNPNAGNEICGQAQPMQIHIECLRLDQDPPDLIELVYNAGQDLIINPAYNETPPLNPPVSQGNYGFRLLSRQDDPGPFPGNQPANDANCTNVANRGWETNDIGRTFEIWGQDIVNGSNVTPTPRGTPVQEITSDGPPPGGISTIWQTFQAPSSGNFIIRLVHGARDAGEIHRITLDNGDTDDAQNGDLIDDITTPAVVTNSPGGPNPWTTFNQTIPLTGGNIYTLALSTTENPPDGNARGGLFTDMRAFLDVPDQRATATTDDDTCVVTVDETSTVTDCQYWAPRCINGEIVSWYNVETGAELDNAAFWGQAPAPDCCLPQPAEDGGGSVAANLVHNYEICGIVGGIPTTLNRVVITDASGGVLLETIVGPDGAPVAPTSYTIGACTADRYVNDEILCDDNGPFLRKYVQNFNGAGLVQVQAFRDFTLAGSLYTPVGTVVNCTSPTIDREGICYVLDSTGTFVNTGWARHDDSIPNTPQTPNGIAFFDNLGNFIDPTLDGFTQVVCERINPAVTPTIFHGEQVLCDDNGPFVRKFIQQPDGSVDSVRDFDLDGNPYVVVGVIEVCPVEVEVQPAEFEFEEEILCDDNGPFFRRTTFNTQTQTYGPVADFTLAGAPYVTVGTVGVCGDTEPAIFQHEEILCDQGNANTQFLRKYIQTADGSIIDVIDMLLDGSLYVGFIGPAVVCPVTAGAPEFETEIVELCDAGNANAPFLRFIIFSQATGAVTSTVDVDYAGALYVPVGPTVKCASDSVLSVQYQCFIDNTSTRFFRAFVFTDDSGVPTAIGDFDNSGAVYVPAPPVLPCDSQILHDSEQEILCDANGDRFLRRYAWQTPSNANPPTVTNWELDGVTPFVPVEPVGQCDDCCPFNAGNGCWDDGVDSGTYVSIRNPDGTFSLIDPVTGLAVDPGDVVACPSQAVTVDPTPISIDSSIQRQTGAGVIVVPAGARSITLASLTTATAAVSVQIAADPAVSVPPGVALSWSVDDRDESLINAYTFTGVAGSDFIVTTTRV